MPQAPRFGTKSELYGEGWSQYRENHLTTLTTASGAPFFDLSSSSVSGGPHQHPAATQKISSPREGRSHLTSV